LKITGLDTDSYDFQFKSIASNDFDQTGDNYYQLGNTVDVTGIQDPIQKAISITSMSMGTKYCNPKDTVLFHTWETYSESFLLTLPGELLIDRWIEFSPAPPAGMEIDVYDGTSNIGTVSQPTSGFWLSEGIGVDRTALENESDHDWIFYMNGMDSNEYTINNYAVSTVTTFPSEYTGAVSNEIYELATASTTIQDPIQYAIDNTFTHTFQYFTTFR